MGRRRRVEPVDPLSVPEALLSFEADAWQSQETAEAWLVRHGLPVFERPVYGPASAHWAAVVTYAKQCGRVSQYGIVDFAWLNSAKIPNSQSRALSERLSALYA